jgi:predicted AAA+ superfamily ATPase
MKELVKEILKETQQQFAGNVRPRARQIDPYLPKVQTIVGPRRAGKSSLLKHTIERLIHQDTAWNKICYLGLEDERLRRQPFEPDIILQAYRELYPENATLQGMFFLFDEIQFMEGWEYFINRIHEHISRTIIITGSNSRTLHTEVASVLRGRGLPVELLTLSFSEYLQFKGIEFEAYGPQAAVVRAAFNDYIIGGGYPETVGLAPHTASQLLQEYFNTVLYRDIIELHQPANYSYLRYLFHRIAANTGKTIAVSKIFQELKSRGYAVSRESLYAMTALAEDVYLFKRISRFDESLIKRENADKKAYFIDTGMLNAIQGSFGSNMGMLLENLVFWHLYRQYGNIYTCDIYYYKDASHECDFVLFKEGGHALPVQVCWQTNDAETRKREIKGLMKACIRTGSRTGVIVTAENESTQKIDSVNIHEIPAWKWCALGYDLFAL